MMGETESHAVHEKHRHTAIIPETHDAETTNEYRVLIATALGFEDRRYPTGFPAAVLSRLYLVILGEQPDSTLTRGDKRVAIAEELDLGDQDRLRDSDHYFDRYKLVQIADELQTRTYTDLEELLESCPGK